MPTLPLADRTDSAGQVVPLTAGETWLSEPEFMPREAIRIAAEVYAEHLNGTPTLVVKIRQGAISTPEMIDRGVTSPAVFEVFTEDQKALVSDDVVGHYVQLELVCTDAPVRATVALVAR